MIGGKNGTTMAATIRGKGTKPSASNSVAGKEGSGRALNRNTAASARMASAYHANNGTFSARNFGSGCAPHQSMASQRIRHAALTAVRKIVDGSAPPPALLRVQSRSSVAHEDGPLSGIGGGVM